MSIDHVDSGFEGNGSLVSCSPSEVIVIVVALPMSEAEFIAVEDRYVESVATAAGVVRENVKVLSIRLKHDGLKV